jgi:predicted nucleotidyltransferase
MQQRDSINQIRAMILPILTKYRVSRAGVFGSYANGSNTENSDIDILVELHPDLSLLDYITIKHELEEKTGHHIDLVEYDTIKPKLRDIILKQEIKIL